MADHEITPVPDFTKVGFEVENASLSAEAQKELENVLALNLNVCVKASYDGKKICFTIPIFGDFCIDSPISLPINADLKACAKTCGSIIPKGLKVTIYFNGNVIFTTVVWGTC